MEESAMIAGRLNTNNDATIKRALKKVFGYERKIKQSEG